MVRKAQLNEMYAKQGIFRNHPSIRRTPTLGNFLAWIVNFLMDFVWSLQSFFSNKVRMAFRVMYVSSMSSCRTPQPHCDPGPLSPDYEMAVT